MKLQVKIMLYILTCFTLQTISIIDNQLDFRFKMVNAACVNYSPKNYFFKPYESSTTAGVTTS